MILINVGNSQLNGQPPPSHKNTSSSSARTSQVSQARPGKEHVSLDESTSKTDCSHPRPCTVSRCNPPSISNLLRPDRNIVYDTPLANEYEKYAIEVHPPSDYQESPHQPYVTAQTFCHNIPTRPMPVTNSYRGEDTLHGSLAAVGGQFADYSNAARASHSNHYQQNSNPALSTSHTSYPETADNASTTLSSYPFRTSYPSDGRVTGFYGCRTDSVASSLPNSQLQNAQILRRNDDLVSHAHSRALAGHKQALNQDPKFNGSAQPGYIQRTNPPYPGVRYDNGVTDLTSMTSHTSRHGLAELPLQTSCGLPGTLISPSHPQDFPINLPSSRYEPPPFSAFTASGSTHVSTRSSIEPSHAHRATLTPTSTELPSTISSNLSVRQAGPSRASSDDPAVCPHCDHIVSRAAKRGDRLSNLNRHIRDKHKRAEGPKPVCPEPGCGKTFERSDYVIRHRRKRHGFQPSSGSSWSARS